jgi:hypothetical protein
MKTKRRKNQNKTKKSEPTKIKESDINFGYDKKNKYELSTMITILRLKIEICPESKSYPKNFNILVQILEMRFFLKKTFEKEENFIDFWNKTESIYKLLLDKITKFKRNEEKFKLVYRSIFKIFKKDDGYSNYEKFYCWLLKKIKTNQSKEKDLAIYISNEQYIIEKKNEKLEDGQNEKKLEKKYNKAIDKDSSSIIYNFSKDGGCEKRLLDYWRDKTENGFVRSTVKNNLKKLGKLEKTLLEKLKEFNYDFEKLVDYVKVGKGFYLPWSFANVKSADELCIKDLENDKNCNKEFKNDEENKEKFDKIKEWWIKKYNIENNLKKEK